MSQNTKIILAERPGNEIPDVNKIFNAVKEEIPKIKEGEVLVKVIYASADPAMRGWIVDRPSYLPPVAIGAVMRSGGVGEVIESQFADIKVGDKVTGLFGWQEYCVAEGKSVNKVVPGIPLELTQGLLGMTGMTAYFGLFDVCKPKAGETILVSGAAGATGSVVVQLAKIAGCQVVAVAGSDDKCQWLKELGADATVNYKTSTNLLKDIFAATPNGIDMYFDNVGGEILDIALARINLHGRIAICGGISQYNQETVGPKNYLNLIVKRAIMQGFLVLDYAPRFAEAFTKMAGWWQEGKLKSKETIIEGVENSPKAFLGLFDGSNTGKTIIRISKQ